MKLGSNKKFFRRLANILFFVGCGAIFLFLWRAPPSTTPPLPRNQEHQLFFSLPKKEAERQCQQCHAPDALAPLPSNHPPPHRCLFCHKRR